MVAEFYGNLWNFIAPKSYRKTASRKNRKFKSRNLEDSSSECWLNID